jgi:[CysO sulfur-carrier protein]-S-L-cysteine hydrolase
MSDLRLPITVDPAESHLRLGRPDYLAMIEHCLRAFPEEGCGLLVGELETGLVIQAIGTRNAAASARVYEIDSRDYLRIDREAETAGQAIIGVFHSHTHTDPYPSPTDVVQAPDPNWHYVLVSLRLEVPSVRSYRVVDGVISEEPIVEAPFAV